MVVSIQATENGLTYTSRSIRGLNTHGNLQTVKSNQGAKVSHHRQLQRARLESLVGKSVDNGIYQRANRLEYRRAKKAAKVTEVTRLDVGQIMSQK